MGSAVGLVAPFRSARRWRIALAGALMLLAAGPLRAAPAPGPSVPALPATATLSEHIDAALSDPLLLDAAVGVHVLDLQSGKVLYERGAAQPLNPASNVKLVTTAAALSLLGPEHRYATNVFVSEDAREGTTIKGNLYIKGEGDPELVSGDLYELATRLRAQGIKKVTGGVVVDASAFDADGLPPGFDQKAELASYRAPGGATSINFNTFVIRARAGDNVGDPVIAQTLPDVGWLDLSVDATTTEGRKRRLWTEVEYKKDRVRLVLHGTAGVDANSESFRYPVDDPTRYLGEVFTMALADAGIKVGRRSPSAGSVPRAAELIETHHSPPLSVLIRAVNKFSNNFMAEQILKTLDDATPKTAAGALRRVTAHITALPGVATKGLALGNGSGLYDNNRVAPAQMTALLAAVYADFRIGPDFMASLAIMGVDGTTRSRLAQTPAAGWVRVKTGTLDGVSALSGYVGAAGRKPLVFSIVMNDLPAGSTGKARAAQNQIADMLARHAAGLPLVDPLAAPLVDAQAAQ